MGPTWRSLGYLVGAPTSAVLAEQAARPPPPRRRGDAPLLMLD